MSASGVQTRTAATARTPAELMARAKAASAKLADMTVSDRVASLRRLTGVILDRQEEIIDAVQKDTGKCRTDALLGEIFSVLDHLHYVVGNAGKVLRDRRVSTPLPLLGKKSRVEFAPLGTVLVISPWNYPFFLGMVPITSAFVCGNAVIYKPSEHAPLTDLVESVLADAGFPSDAVQVAYGTGDVARAIIDEGPDKIFFTGSTATGRKILAQAAPKLIPVDLELGGKDPMIVFEDANLGRAAAGALWGGLTNTGQACTSVERLYVHESVYAAFRDRLVAEAGTLRQSVDTDGGADLGRITAGFQVEKIRAQLDEAKAAGARLLTGGEWDGKSPLVPPTVVDGAPADCALLREETFGPVIPMVPFRTEDEVVRLANASPYGLSASVWSKDVGRAERVARRLQVGNVSINNVMLTEGNAALPFGGVKASGMGRYKGEFGLYAFSNVKSVLVDKDSAKRETNWYPYTPEKYRLFSRLIQALFRGGVVNLIRFVLIGLKLESMAGKARR